jgi:hypothetical protein
MSLPFDLTRLAGLRLGLVGHQVIIVEELIIEYHKIRTGRFKLYLGIAPTTVSRETWLGMWYVLTVVSMMMTLGTLVCGADCHKLGEGD